MDALTHVLEATRLKGGVFLHAEFSDPWCLESRVSPENCERYLGPGLDIIAYHYVLEGRLRLREGSGPTLDLEPGEMVLLPHNDQHLLGGDLDLPPTRGDEVVQPGAEGGLASIRMGGGGTRCRIICGFLGAKNLDRNPLIKALPPVLHLDARKGTAAEWIRSTFHYAADEITAGSPGSGTVMAKLSELLFVEAVRRYLEQLPEGQAGWLAGLKDPYLAPALALLHACPERDWTAGELGRQIGLSRSALADRFRRLIGVPPIQYLTQWRMQVAASALGSSRQTVQQVAQRVGYDSEAAFSRAFKREMGLSPAAWRKKTGPAGPVG